MLLKSGAGVTKDPWESLAGLRFSRGFEVSRYFRKRMTPINRKKIIQKNRKIISQKNRRKKKMSEKPKKII